jgi:hypothetical protein
VKKIMKPKDDATIVAFCDIEIMRFGTIYGARVAMKRDGSGHFVAMPQRDYKELPSKGV